MSESAHPLVLRAREALARSEIKSAEAAVEERLKTAGRDINALEVRYLIQKHRGQLGEAARTLDAVIGINARADWAYNELIALLMTHGKSARCGAGRARRPCARIPPTVRHTTCLASSSPTCMTFHRVSGISGARWSWRPQPQAAFLTNLANNLAKQGRSEEADGYFSRSLELAPTDVTTLTSWSALRAERGDLAGAGELLDRAEAASSAADVGLQRAHLLARAGKSEESIAIINVGKTLTGAGQLARGRLQERLGRYEEAWQDFVAGKRKLATEAGGLQYKADAVEALFGRFKEFFSRAKLRPAAPSGLAYRRAAAHFHNGSAALGHDTRGADRLESLHRDRRRRARFSERARKVASDLLPAPQPFPGKPRAELDRGPALRRDPVSRLLPGTRRALRLLRNDKAFFTDKMPFNEVYLPLLKMAFPQAKIVHVMRHPLDVCVSTMSNDVTQGFNCGYRIEDTAHHLAAVFDLFGHYHRELDLGDYVLQYEALVADPAGQTRKLLDYLALPFEEGCLRLGKLSDGAVNRHSHYAHICDPM